MFLIVGRMMRMAEGGTLGIPFNHKLPCSVCGEIKQALDFVEGRLVCPRCLKEMS